MRAASALPIRRTPGKHLAVFQLLRDINTAGTVVVMATHDLDLVRQAPYRSIELREGSVVFDSAVDEAEETEVS